MAFVIIAIALALIAFAIYQTVQKIRGKSKMASCCGSGGNVVKRKVEDTDASHYPFHYKVSVANMKCSNCAANVENAINDAGGIWARVNLGKGEVDVLSKEPRVKEDFVNSLTSTDYEVTGFRKA